MTPLVAACMASLSTLAVVGASDPLPGPRDELVPDPRPCNVAIVLVASDGSSVSRTIDAMTGGLGFSHCYVDPCRVDERGESMVVGYSVARGVHWQRASEYKPTRRHVRIELDARTGAEVWGCVRTRFGRPLRASAIAFGIDSASTCVGLVVSCLPYAMQQRMRRYQVGPCISPNTLAAFFGVDAETVRVFVANPNFGGV